MLFILNIDLKTTYKFEFFQAFRCPVHYSDTGFEYMKDADEDTIFVVENFDGTIFRSLHREDCRIIAPPVIIKAARDGTVSLYI